MTYHLGISCGFHDAGVSVVDPKGQILFASHSERYSKTKHDALLCEEIILDALKHIDGDFQVDYYEKPWLKLVRQVKAGQPLGPLRMKSILGLDLYERYFEDVKIVTHKHHMSHAAAGFQTSPYENATVVIIDAIGELDTISIWDAWYDEKGKAQYKKLYSNSYPDSIGLFYSAMTQKAGLKPLDEEYILMGMAAYGKPIHMHQMERDLIEDSTNIVFKNNLHIGLPDNFLPNADPMDIAASSQLVVEQLIRTVIAKARMLGKSSNLVYGGGVALNCLANRMLGDYFRNIWIMPNPGDAGNSLGAAALGYGKKLLWKDAFLGHDIPGYYPVKNLYAQLLKNKIVGVATGRAEFGPRALGHRSLLADPRGNEIKDQVNEIKRRQKFRPFAPMILEEMVTEHFIMPKNWANSRYMQVVAECKHPELYPAIVHADNTSRVQTVPKNAGGIRTLLELWYKTTGCPILLNTSLNIRGEPMVNDRQDADRFEKLYGVKVCS